LKSRQSSPYDGSVTTAITVPSKPELSPSELRETILRVASASFYAEGVRAVGVDTIVKRAGVAKMTLYKHFPSKEALIVAVLRRHDAWWREMLPRRTRERSRSPQDGVISVFDALFEWFTDSAFRGCPFINIAVEFPDPESLIGQEVAIHRNFTLKFLESLCKDAGLAQSARLGAELMVLVDGAIIGAWLSDPTIAVRNAKHAAKAIVDEAGVMKKAAIRESRA